MLFPYKIISMNDLRDGGTKSCTSGTAFTLIFLFTYLIISVYIQDKFCSLFCSFQFKVTKFIGTCLVKFGIILQKQRFQICFVIVFWK